MQGQILFLSIHIRWAVNDKARKIRIILDCAYIGPKI